MRLTTITLTNLLVVAALLWSPHLVAAEEDRPSWAASIIRFFFPKKTTIAQTIDSYEVLETIPHDPRAFTQGLTFDPSNGDMVYESTGL